METPLILKNSHQPTEYDITLNVDHEKSNFKGSVTVLLVKSRDATVSDGDDFEFWVNASELVLLSAAFDAQTSQFKAKVSYDKEKGLAKLVVENGKELYNQESLSLEIGFIGKINTIKTFQDVTKGLFRTNYLGERSNKATNYILATHCQTSYARNIFPCIDEPASKAKITLTIETNSRFKVLANTSPESKQVDEERELQIIKFKQSPPITPSIFGFVIGDLDFIETSVELSQGKIPVRFYSAIGNISGSAYALDVASKALPFIESVLVREYPLDKLDFIALPFLSDGAMENFGLITIQSGHILVQSLANKKVTQTIRQLVVHELIHHWIGNNVSFDEWSHLWLNEAFATWFAKYILYKLDLDASDKDVWISQVDEEIEAVFEEDASLKACTVMNNSTKSIKSTFDAFQIPAYQKGIQFLRMFANTFEGTFDDHLDKFTATLAKFIQDNDFRSIKPIEIWKAFNNESKIDFLAFAHSWLRVAGFPIVSVSLNDEGNVIVEQNRFLEFSTPQLENLENTPYHVPLAIRINDGSVVNTILTDRRMTLENIKSTEFVVLNVNRTGFYRVSYEDLSVIENIVNNFSKLSSADLIGIINFIALVKFSEKLIDSPVLDFKVLRIALTNLESVENSYKLYASRESYNAFSEWVVKMNAKLFNKLQWNIDYETLNSHELETRALILSIGINTAEVGKLCDTLFKKLLHGPSRFRSREIPGATVSHIFAGSAPDIQHAAISSIGFTRDPALVKRVLNFVTTNIESNLIETALVGLQFNNEMNKKALWHWFTLHYDQWALKSCRAGSKISADMRKTLKGITVIILAGMTTDEDKKAIKEFVNDKLSKLPDHELKETVKLVEDSQIEKIKISSSADELSTFL
ncbi:hypothetical protein BN1211_0921 [Cyberlindnera jadinii]|uniref:Aminopeptidase n=1 Tax=Cyberlindnera jadinii (strain ATCC 18201 / CBS 1600 / BCRC 20928 / JCM 3617 / NBRC 0987 / NRRL Y-1542) TaxID=983966 RepID=A0A0H5CAP9_CYBJN|nr:hypothetical protein BN1211_0921 [Cyberlindnera jadinii]